MSIYAFEWGDCEVKTAPILTQGGWVRMCGRPHHRGSPANALRATLRSRFAPRDETLRPSRWHERLVSGAPQEYPLLTSHECLPPLAMPC